MSRGISPRVNSVGSIWILSLLTFAVKVIDVDGDSCHEVRTAFQVRHVGPPHRVPETPDTDVDLLVCKHQGPSCCTRKMEESYQFAVKREIHLDIQTYNYHLENLLSGHSDAFQDMFQYLLSFSQGHLSSMLEGSYPSLSRQALPHVNQLFSTLSFYLQGENVSAEVAVHQFFNNLFPLTYTRLINPGIQSSVMVGSEMGDCLRMTRKDINPFGNHPAVMAKELAEALGTGRQLGLALKEGQKVTNATSHAILSKECVKSLMKMLYCSHCRGLTLIKPCIGYCLNVRRGCLASVSEMDQPWRRYTRLLEQLTHAMAGHHSLELALLGVRGHVNEALLFAQIHGLDTTAKVDKVCGLSTEKPAHMHPTSPEVKTSTVTLSSPFPSVTPSQPLPEQWLLKLAHLRSSLPLKSSMNNYQNLGNLSREFLINLQHYKSFFLTLPELLCQGDNVAEDSTCWSGDDVVKSYTGRVAGNGLHAQRQNPEVKVRGMDPTMAEVKERLEQFIQETEERFPNLPDVWDELGSGPTEEGSTSDDCDDEDGCPASGDGQENYIHEDFYSNGKSLGSSPGGNTPQEKPSRLPSVRAIEGSASTSWAQYWSLALLFVGLCLQWILF